MRRTLVDIPIPPRWKLLWDTWDLRGFIILSLSLQTLLILFAPLRKRTKSNWILMPLWSAYLLADWAANFAVGLISNSQGNPSGSTDKIDNENLLSFWAPFLLVHLGGPDTITAFALEDNELWLRHLLGLVFQCLAAVYVFVQSIPNDLWIPTLLMFLTGIIKYAERTRALYLASADRFKDSMLTDADPGPNYAKLMDEYYSKKRAKLPTRIQMVPEPDGAAKSANKAKKGNLTELEVIQYAYRFFETFKGLVVDLIFSRKERNQSRNFFLNRTAKDAFKVVEVELNFFYEVLFTKLPVVYGLLGAVARVFSLATVCAAFVLFRYKNKNNYAHADVKITYVLLTGALALDAIALFMLVFSDWTILLFRKSPDDELNPKSCWTKIVSSFLRFMTEGTFRDPKETQPKTSESKTNESKTSESKISETKTSESKTSESKTNTRPAQIKTNIWMIQFFKRRWSESISTYNLIHYCLNRRSNISQFVYDFVGLSAFLDSISYVKAETFTPELRDFIFEELKSKSELADDLETAKEISAARGDWVLRVEEGWSILLPYVLDVDYDQSLLLWHIATELCYNDELRDKVEPKENGDKHQMSNTATKTVNLSKTPGNHREIAKLLSDYMLYLLIMQPSMMSAIAGIGQIRFRDTCAEAKRFFKNLQVSEEQEEEKTKENQDKSKDNQEKTKEKQEKQKKYQEKTKESKVDLEQNQQIRACIELLKVETEVEPVTVKGDKSKSLLFDGCILAKKLMRIDRENKHLNKWEIISKVWVELLCYGASHSRANTQAAQVSRGGELITIVWLLMAHLGLGDQFQINEGQARAKLIVGK